MELFDESDALLSAFLDRKEREGKVRFYAYQGPTAWPIAPARNLVLAHETAVELGSSRDFSTAGLYWRDASQRSNPNRITLVGPDIQALAGQKVSFGKVVRIEGKGFTPENAYPRYREMALVRYGLHLKGYMMRAVSQYQREWVRISHEALAMGLSLKVIGGALIDELLKLAYVSRVEVVFVTSGRDDVEALHGVSRIAGNILGAMDKLSQETHIADCDKCDFSDACSEVAALRALRRAQMN